jgi:hypothetical protein
MTKFERLSTYLRIAISCSSLSSDRFAYGGVSLSHLETIDVVLVVYLSSYAQPAIEMALFMFAY